MWWPTLVCYVKMGLGPFFIQEQWLALLFFKRGKFGDSYLSIFYSLWKKGRKDSLIFSMEKGSPKAPFSVLILTLGSLHSRVRGRPSLPTEGRLQVSFCWRPLDLNPIVGIVSAFLRTLPL